MTFEKLTAEHVARLGPLADIHAGYEITPELALDLEQLGGKAAVDDDGMVLAIAGIMPRWEGVGLAWAWLSRDWRKYARRITAEIIANLAASKCHRIELGVKVGFDRGARWAERMGFELETPCAKGWGPDGSDFAIYVRVK